MFLLKGGYCCSCLGVDSVVLVEGWIVLFALGEGWIVLFALVEGWIVLFVLVEGWMVLCFLSKVGYHRSFPVKSLRQT